MSNHRLHYRSHVLALLLAVVLLIAGAAGASDIESPHHSTFTITSHPVPGGHAPGSVTPDAEDDTPGALTRVSSWRFDGQKSEGTADADSGGPVIASVSPSIASAGTNTTITITGTGFGPTRTSPADVGFTAAGGILWASGRNDPDANLDEIVSWSDTEIRVKVPTGSMEDGHDDSASSGTVRIVTAGNRTSNAVPFAVSFGVTRLKWAARPVFLVNDNCPGITGGAAAVRRAAATWNAALPTAFQVDCSGSTTSTTNDYDGVNLIAWGSTPGATIWYDESGAIVEADIILDASLNWTTGTASVSVYSAEALALQSLGYGLGIASLSGKEPQGPSDVGKVCSRWRGDDLGNMNLVTLSPADRAAAAYLYNGGSANPPLLAAAFTADRIAGRAPLTVQFDDASIGGATAWRWNFGDGGSSTVRNPAHTYAVPGTYTVALTTSAVGYPDDTVRAIELITVAAPISPVPGGIGAPTDTGGDGTYDDVNGNDRKDFADVSLFFTQMSWIAANEPVTAFDYNANGRIDFADVVWLFNTL